MEARREFIQNMTRMTAGVMGSNAIAGSTAQSPRDQWGELLPLRKLGKTGELVTMLGVGGFHVGWTSERDAQEVVETAIEGGIRFFDTAHNYQKGTSEQRYGKYLLPKYRDDIFLMTKSQARDAKKLREEFELSLSRMGADSIDLLQLHALSSPSDAASRVENGVYDALAEILASGKARYVGFTGHEDPLAQLELLKRVPADHIFSTAQMPINLVDWSIDKSFIKQMVPAAMEHRLGILAMKTLANGRFFSQTIARGKPVWSCDHPVVPNAVSVKEAIHFAWSMPVSVLITGAERKDLLEEKIELAKSFAMLTEADRETLLERVLQVPGREKIEWYKFPRKRNADRS
jgi:aryl-alcohol dehydrogenase-like predicted oxidoreductase